jgi:hypothetical protein
MGGVLIMIDLFATLKGQIQLTLSGKAARKMLRERALKIAPSTQI